MHAGGRHPILVMAAVLVCATVAADHAAMAAQSRAAVPDWNGVWVIAGGVLDKPDQSFLFTPGRFDPADAARFSIAPPAYKGEYLQKYHAMQRATQTALATGKDARNPCLPPGMPGFWYGPYAFEIIQTPRQINVYQEGLEQTRRIYLDERKQPAPDDLNPSYNGHSIGHWEGKVLVVDTVGMRSDTPIILGITSAGPHSDAMHITERFQSEGPDLLKVVMTVDDPKAFSKPWVYVVRLHRKHGMEIMEYVCENNNHTIQ